MNDVYIIAEVGQNHNGNIKMAKQLIDMASMPIIDKAFNKLLKGIDAVKFTKRDLTEELTLPEWNRPYNSQNSFGKTYGEHREALELSYEEHIELFQYAKEKELDFVDTLTSIKTLELLNYIDINYIKVASRDLTNIPLLIEIGKTKKPVILSTGMGGLPEIDKAVDTITRFHDQIVILHCLSQYPSAYSELNLFSIPFLKKRYPFKIGYSDHSVGIVIPSVAVALGAEFIEKHITLNHSLKGSDHKGALEPDGLWRMARDIRNVELSLGEMKKEISPVVETVKQKLERSLCTRVELKKGDILSEDMLIMLSPGGGLKWETKTKILGKPANTKIDSMSMLSLKQFDI